MPNTTQPSWEETEFGQLILRPFKSAPYPHESRDAGFKGKTKEFPRDPHYTDSTVGIFIPAHYVARADDAVHFVMYFHGHGNNVAKTLAEYKMPQRFSAAKINAILIIPQGPRDAPDSGGGKLELDRGAFATLITHVQTFLLDQRKIRAKQVGNVALAAHSGGYKVAAAVLDHGGMAEHVTDALLFDSAYGSLEWFSAWCAAERSHRLVSIFTEHLADENEQLMALLDKAGVPYARLDESKLTDDQLRARQPIFMPTTAGHGYVPSKFFTQLLSTSALAV
ncbi:MAG: hypothetical protein QOF78_1979 [Phycisphaerales bacterium]|jgi:hypothetical protein|nr:hypothetical protein [Phycisphaerales bacterium]